MANQECKVRPTLFNFNSNEQSCYPDSVTVIIYSGRCNDIGKYYSKLYVPDVFKDIIIKVSYMMPRTNETRYISRHETCACKCGIYSSVCNDRQHWNNYICKCQGKKLIDTGRCHEGYISNTSVCDCKCDKLCDLDEYLDHMNWKCRQGLTDQLLP